MATKRMYKKLSKTSRAEQSCAEKKKRQKKPKQNLNIRSGSWYWYLEALSAQALYIQKLTVQNILKTNAQYQDTEKNFQIIIFKL